ncbi:hypothetical protein F4813DRAFT_362748 [Daldinia decipiens]|uniref:uncharacterized protein n=1 Tax=Daldinia decipiens TaxID=326647 RepID=UPI0020C3E7B9|nr:uncharacterized protein F4813DRAFT_362748 [Daldinia decipiens]KAI1656669.1 hypothetical protein F4813DRAFT_362748 [Daldinia decipiens]
MDLLTQEAKPGWPSGRVPTEIFSMIVEHLPKRATLKQLRLVNREFHTKLQSEFFKNLVIDVGSKFSTSSNVGYRCLDGSTPDDITEYIMSSNGFHNAASFVRRLAFALDLTEHELATPEIEEDDDIEIRKWGVYRWPVTPGSRLSRSRLEKITESLERSRGISHIMSKATQIQELALSCDGGLGYLQGPDVNPHQPPDPQPIFGELNQAQGVADPSLPSLQISFDKPYKLERMEKRLAAQGIPRDDISDTIKKILKTEGISMNQFTHETRTRAALPVSRHGEQKITRFLYWHGHYRLQPDQLTEAQAKLIFQHVTTQQALVQAFMFTAMKHGESCKYLTKVNIAHLSSFHVHLLCMDAFWSKLPALEEVSLGIAPDWREVTVKDRYTLETRQVYPTDALPEVFKLLNDHIGRQERIKRLHFEWLCGGELAAGWLQRNSYVLPAPFLKKHRLVIFSGKENLLILPHVTHLSLKNCWFAPNVFYRIIHTMAKQHSLVSLELETVSLTGRPILRETLAGSDVDDDPWPISPSGSHLPSLVRDSLTLSWCHVIDMLTPGPTFKESFLEENFPTEPQLSIRKDLKLQKLVFKSCGYVDIPDSRFVYNARVSKRPYPLGLRRGARAMSRRYHAKRRSLAGFMQVNTDRHLGRITEVLDPREEYCMQTAFGLHAGWPDTDAYGLSRHQAALCDGIAYPGYGRFSGTIDAGSFMDINSDHRAQAYELDTSRFDFDYEEDDNEALEEMLNGFELELGYNFPRPGNDNN